VPTYGDFEVRLKNDGRSIETCLDVFSIRKTSFQYVSWCRPQESVFVDYEMVAVDDDSPPLVLVVVFQMQTRNIYCHYSVFGH